MARIHAPAAAPALRSRLLLAALAMLLGSLPIAGASAGSFNELYAFQGPVLGDGAASYGNLVTDKTGALYGTTYYGGNSGCDAGTGCGTVFKLTPPPKGKGSWTETILYRFEDSADGGFPYTALLIDENGALYGATEYGGYGNGVVFKLTPPAKGKGAWAETTLHNFGLGQDGYDASSPLVMGPKGALYGTTYYGGTGGCTVMTAVVGCGTVFGLTPKGKGYAYKLIHMFAGPAGADGTGPISYSTGLVVAPSGNVLFGTTYYGGTGSCGTSGFTLGCGTVFAVTRKSSSGPWSELVLHDFAGGSSDGEYPYGNVIRDKQGHLFGATYEGGSSNYGTVFEIAPTAGSPLTILHNFSYSGTDGAYPEDGLVMGPGGALYGTTYYGGNLQCNGSTGCGTVFKVARSGATWTTKTLFAFGYANGSFLQNGVIPGPSGQLFGMTPFGGNACNVSNYGCGTVFELTP